MLLNIMIGHLRRARSACKLSLELLLANAHGALFIVSMTSNSGPVGG